MNSPRISLCRDCPPGFEFREELRARDVRRGAFVLFDASLEHALSCLRSFPNAASGIIVTLGEAFVWSKTNGGHLHVEMAEALLRSQPGIIDCMLHLVSQGQTLHDLSHAQQLDLRRSREDRRRAREEFTTTRESLLREMQERKAATEALRESRKNLAITLNSIADAVVATNASGIVIGINPVAQTLLKCSAKECVGRNLSRVMRLWTGSVSEGAERKMVSLAEVLKGEVFIEFPVETTLVRRDGSEAMVAGSAAPIRDEAGKVLGVVVAFRDITSRLRLEEQYRHSQKMESIGRLAGGVAHDFNNLLGGIMGFADLLLFSLSHSAKEYGYAHSILEASQRAAELTKQLLAFSRKGKLASVPVDINDAVGEVVKLLGRTFDPSIVIKVVPSSEAPVVLGDMSQIQSALLNLGVNARDAMPEGGELAFEVQVVTLTNDNCRFDSGDLSPGAFVKISVTDSGQGIDSGVLPHIFEPFFTTKEVGKGTGLGLAAVYGSVLEHHGAIEVHSAPLRGSTFTIYLPLAKNVTVQKTQERVKLPQGSGRVLLVDDDPGLRLLGKELLSGLGHEVLVAESGVEALEIFREQGDHISVVLLDLTMPKMSGKDTFREMKKLNPDVRVIICSGYSFDDSVKLLLREGAISFLQKPYRIAELAKCLADACQTTEHRSAH